MSFSSTASRDVSSNGSGRNLPYLLPGLDRNASTNRETRTPLRKKRRSKAKTNIENSLTRRYKSEPKLDSKGYVNFSGIEKSRSQHLHSEDDSDNRPHSDSYSKVSVKSHRKDTSRTVKIYKDNKAISPSLRITLSKNKYRSMSHLLSELHIGMNLNIEPRSIVSKDGQSIDRLEDFQDKGEYYLSLTTTPKQKTVRRATSYLNSTWTAGDFQGMTDSSHPGQTNNIVNMRLLTADRSRGLTQREGISSGATKVINLITNSKQTKSWKLSFDYEAFSNFQHALDEVNRIVDPAVGKVVRLCTKKGRRIESLDELFYGTQGVIVAIVGSEEHDTTGKNGDDSDGANVYVIDDGKDKPLDNGDAHILADGTMHTFKQPLPQENAGANDFPFNLRHNHQPPSEQLCVEWIYGFNGNVNSIVVLPTGVVIYCISTVAVLYDIDSQYQRHYMEHSYEIKAIALHPNQTVVATSQAQGQITEQDSIVNVFIWNAYTLATLSVLSFEAIGLSVKCLSFSVEDDGYKLLTVDSDGHSCRLLMWDWRNSDILARSEGYETIEKAARIHPMDSRSVVTCGKEHIYFWSERGQVLDRTAAHFFEFSKPAFVNCLAITTVGDILTGDSNGLIVCWTRETKKVKYILRDEGQTNITALNVLPNGFIMAASGERKTMRVWDVGDTNRKIVEQIEIEQGSGHATSIAFMPDHSASQLDKLDLLIGSTDNCILRGTIKTEFQTLVQGHHNGVSGVTVSPDNELFFTAGLDKMVAMWSGLDKVPLWKQVTDYFLSCVCWYQNGAVIAVGTSAGRWIVMDSNTGHHIASFQSGNEAITCLCYSPDGESITVGTAGFVLHFFTVTDGGSSYRKSMVLQTSFPHITAMDWCVQSNYLRTMSKSYELTTWSMSTEKVVENAEELRDIEWSSHRTPLSYKAAGAWGEDTEDHPIVCCDTSPFGHLLCASLPDGHTRLFVFPCFLPKAPYLEYKVHNSRISQISFSRSTERMYTSGRYDSAVIQWKLLTGRERDAVPTKQKPFIKENLLKSEKKEIGNELSMTYKVGARRVRLDAEVGASRAKTVDVSAVDDDGPNHTINADILSAHDVHTSRTTGGNSRKGIYNRTKGFVDNYDVFMPTTNEMGQRQRTNRLLKY